MPSLRASPTVGDMERARERAEDAFLRRLPKAELHVHIEGTFEPELVFEIAGRNGVKLPYRSAKELRDAYQFADLQAFLDVYYQGMAALQKRRDFRDLTIAYLERAHGDGVVHVEVFFDPQAHTARGVGFDVVLDGIWDGLEEGERRFGITSRLILCFLRHLDEEDAFRTLDAALPHRDRIFGVGLDSSELGHPPSKFERVFRKARDAGFLPVAHAGEEGPADYVREALDLLGVARIDHGNRALENPSLVQRLAAEGVPLTVCPLSNLRLGGVKRLEDHPLREMLDVGLLATVNSDDPAYFGGYLLDNYRAVRDALGLTPDQIVRLARNSIVASFASPAAKSGWLAKIDEGSD